MKSIRLQAQQAISNEPLQSALDRNADGRIEALHSAMGALVDPEASKQRAHAIRKEVLEKHQEYLDQFAHNAARSGFIVHHAQDGEQACQIVLDIARQADAQMIAKSKSMVTEEIQLNRNLEQAGLRVVETDLGEFIVQLRNETPAHIITPALHLLREQVAETFQNELGMPYSAEVEDITAFARQKLRQVFLAAPIGISGVNFGVAESGALCLVTNEGNGRMVTTLPSIHVAIMGVERLVPSYRDLEVMLRVLARSATGQKSSSYVSLLLGPRSEADPDGPEVRHVILVDNGRMSMRVSGLSDALLCIRCGACLNACPVFREIGGHAYGSVYAGPIGSLVSPGLFGMKEFGHLAGVSTLCGACSEVCPVGVDFPTLLLRIRAELSQVSGSPTWSKLGMRLYSWFAESPGRFRLAQRIGALIAGRNDRWLSRLPPPLNRWTQSRQFPPFAKIPFRERVKSLDLEGRRTQQTAHLPDADHELAQEQSQTDLLQQFKTALSEVGAELIRCSQAELAQVFEELARSKALKHMLAWGDINPILASTLSTLQELGVRVDHPHVPGGEERVAATRAYAEADSGLTGASAAIAETGTLIIPSGDGRSQLASLLPLLHIAVLHSKDIHASMEAWMADESFPSQLQGHSISLVTGPSRTADIEMTLTIGVHGPRELIVVCVD
jgi:L-lactate dehydrogenase complex protein LldF